jgi:hypothetical protein
LTSKIPIRKPIEENFLAVAAPRPEAAPDTTATADFPNIIF